MGDRARVVMIERHGADYAEIEPPMPVLCGGRERSRADHTALAATANLDVTDVTAIVGSWDVAAVKPAVADPPLVSIHRPTPARAPFLNQTLSDLHADSIQGRKDVNDWASAMTVWKSSGGDPIRGRSEKADATAR